MIMENSISETLIESIEKNLDDFYIKCSNHPNFELNMTDKISWISPKKADWPSCIFRANFKNTNINNEIKKVKKLIQANKVPNAWTVGPLTKPLNLGEMLERHGFLNVYHQVGMALNLSVLEDSIVKKYNFDIKIIENEENIKDWSKIVSSVFNIKVDNELLKYLLIQNEIKFYIGIFDGKVVSALMLYLIPGVAGLHAVSTLPDYRKKGFALILSRKALLDAYTLGYKIGVLQASSTGQYVYRKLGFKNMCDINSYAINEE